MAKNGKIKIEFDKDGILSKKAWKVLRQLLEDHPRSSYLVFDARPAEYDPWPVGDDKICGSPHEDPPNPLLFCSFRRISLEDQEG